jgi:hypothetical protein
LGSSAFGHCHGQVSVLLMRFCSLPEALMVDALLSDAKSFDG